MLWPANKQQRMESDLEEGEVPDSENEGDEGGQNKVCGSLVFFWHFLL